MKYYKPVHFKTEEFVPESIFAARGEKSLELMDARILYTADCLREFLGVPLIINTWLWNGSTQYRGFRPQGIGVGSALSQHKYGRALDFVSKKMTAEQMRLKILECSKLFPYITFMENKVNWVHVDNRSSQHEGIHLFNP